MVFQLNLLTFNFIFSHSKLQHIPFFYIHTLYRSSKDFMLYLYVYIISYFLMIVIID